MSGNKLVRVVLTWAWYIMPHVVIWLSSDLETLGILAELTTVIIVTWSWHIQEFSTDHLASLSH